jgi:DNA-binding transcriptional LysR family regulator
MMELHQLRYLRAVIRTGSVTLAAEAEHVAQPSVSKQMRLLERELGVPLFHRVGRRVIPTEAAIELADCADRVFDDLGATTAAIAGPGSRLGGSLRICATETVANHLLPPALSSLRAANATARVSVEMLGTDDVIARVLGDDVELGFVVLPLADSRLEVNPLLSEDVLVAFPLGHRWAKSEQISMAELLAEPELLLSMPGHGLRSQVDEAAQVLGIDITPRIEMRSQQALLGMVASGGGVALAPRMSLEGRNDVGSRTLTPPVRRGIGWIRRRGRHLPPVAMDLLTLLGSD